VSDIRTARKKPAAVQVWEWKGQERDQWPEWLPDLVEWTAKEGTMLYIRGHMDRPAQLGDFIINQDGDIYPIGRDVFQRTYEYL
jgi:hypothetical protein